jgi:hypothetical protein
LYSNKKGTKTASGNRIAREKIFCGNKTLPDGYDRSGTRFECLKRGYGVCLYSRNDAFETTPVIIHKDDGILTVNNIKEIKTLNELKKIDFKKQDLKTLDAIVRRIDQIKHGRPEGSRLAFIEISDYLKKGERSRAFRLAKINRYFNSLEE